jgi:hypothetical protein
MAATGVEAALRTMVETECSRVAAVALMRRTIDRLNPARAVTVKSLSM